MTPPVDANEFEVLDTLLQSSGWTYLKSRLNELWGRSGQRYGDLIERMANAVNDRESVAEEIQRVIWLRKEIEQFFMAIESRHAALRAQRSEPEQAQSRRGVL